MALSTFPLPSMVSLTVDGAIDTAAALTASDDVLTAAIELAAERMTTLRASRGSLAFTDAKTAHTVLSAERTSRQVAAHRAASPVPAPRLHPCGPGCTDSLRPVSECRCQCGGGSHGRTATTLTVETYPYRTVYARAEQLAHDVWVGYDAIRDTWGTWTVSRVLDVGVTRRTEPVKADLPDRVTAEAHALALATGGAR